MGKVVKGIGKVIGKVAGVAAPFAGLIPGIGPLAAAGLGAGGKVLSRALGGKNTFGRGGLGEIAGAGLAGAGGKFLSNRLPQGFLGKIGRAVSQPNILGNAQGKLDFGKVLGTGMAGLNLAGARAQRRSAERYGNAQTDIRNQLMSRILSGNAQKYNFQPEP